MIILDPPRSKKTQPAMSADLEWALDTIQKGAEERLEALRKKKQQAKQGEASGEMIPVLFGYIEKGDPDREEKEEITVKKDKEAGDAQLDDKPKEKDTKEVNDNESTDKVTPKKPRSTPSVSKIKQQRQ